MKKAFFMLLILVTISACKESGRRTIDTALSESIMYGELSIESIDSVNIYRLNQEEGFVDDASKLNEGKLIKLISGENLIPFFSFRNSLRWTGYDSCFKSREDETYHFIVNIRSEVGVGYFIANTCPDKIGELMVIRYLFENGETGVAYSEKLFGLL